MGEPAEKTSAADAAGTTEAVVFDLAGTPLLESGRSDDVAASGSDLVARVKVYASGGENATHAHPREEHLFLVLDGAACFHLGREGERRVEVGRNAGVLVPAGAWYRFESVGEDNLVLLRVGRGRRGETARVGPDGRAMAGGSVANKHVPGVPRPGAFLGPG